ncbi:hypothetical protein CRV12_01990 [Candidatus Pantoea edessiphila]|uniref:PpiC domain-containing protein n=1 Tax=Candidatus Pantoea edessiphila TaxID=2044610 RepID=A0A2P5T075_9GAMM|nr:peptidylprolyl isomerase [Candidatus Pantoea edessiphila]PPI87966.1 hypothetical protein CRV12_01990 [Candidatus Pantoea edessiphila]
MKNWKILIFSSLLVSTNVLAINKLTDSIAVIVNNDIILESEIKEGIAKLQFEKYNTNTESPDNNTLRNEIIQKKIIEKIVFQIGNQAGLNIDNDQLDKIIKNISAINHINMEEFYKYLVSKHIKYNTYREQILKQIIISIISNKELLNRIIIYPQEIDRLSTQVLLNIINDSEINLSQIILPLPEKPTDKQLYEKKILAENIILKLKKGFNLNQLAKNKLSLFKIENMGWNSIKKIPSIFANKLLKSEKGDIIGPIRSGIGFHILKVNDIYNNNKNNPVSEIKLRCFTIKQNPKIILNKQNLAKLKHVISLLNVKKSNFTNIVKQLSEYSFFVNTSEFPKWILFYNKSHQSIINSFIKSKDNQISQPIYFNGIWYIFQKLNIHEINQNNTTQKKISFMNIMNNKLNEEVESLIKQRIAKSYIKIIKDD